MTTTTLAVQQRLRDLGYPVGPVDGIPGRLTIAAVEAFQRQKGLTVDGIVGPVTIAALNMAAQHGSDVIPLSDEVVPPWIENVILHIGLQEVRDNKALRDYLDSDGSTVGDPALIPWCGDLVQTAFALTLPKEPLPANPFWATNWSRFGLPAPVGTVPLGAVAAKARRDAKGNLIGGHVFFVVGHDETCFHALGGNQSNSICIVRILKSELVGTLRWPKTYPLPTKSLPMTTIDATIKLIEGVQHVQVLPVDHTSEA